MEGIMEQNVTGRYEQFAETIQEKLKEEKIKIEMQADWKNIEQYYSYEAFCDIYGKMLEYARLACRESEGTQTVGVRIQNYGTTFRICVTSPFSEKMLPMVTEILENGDTSGAESFAQAFHRWKAAAERASGLCAMRLPDEADAGMRFEMVMPKKIFSEQFR